MNVRRQLWTACLLAPLAAQAEEPADGKQPQADYLGKVYRAEAEMHAFYRDAEHSQPLEFVDHPIMRWNNEGVWSGEVFVWTYAGRPEIIGCMLSGPAGNGRRNVFDEFHLLADSPIAPADLQTHRRWAPEAGLKLELLSHAAKPPASAAARLTQMRKISREFTGHMQFRSPWELRLLPQPLFRYGDEQGDVRDGALFAYVWNLGTDPELILLLECRRGADGFAWHYAPVRFSNRELWLKYAGSEVWRVEAHQEPQGGVVTALYTTAYARTIPGKDPNPGEDPKPDDPNQDAVSKKSTKPADSK
ncbi:MAG TPA: hypothetical protein VMV10_22595 [Pirellulales bacterium]|nr:hypothetical protein [Pirellulales bacterium]